MLELIFIGAVVTGIARLLKGGGTEEESGSTWQEDPRANMSTDEILQLDDPGQAQARRDAAEASLRRQMARASKYTVL